MLALKTREGSMLNVKVADDARVSALVKASLTDIQKDSFIGVAGMPRPDGSVEAFSVHIFLPAQRGVVPDRHGPWDARPGSTMTNAYVESMVKDKDGETLTVKFKEGEKKIVVTPQTTIAAVTKGDKSELKAGASYHHLRLGEAGGRLGAGQGHVCRARCAAGDVTSPPAASARAGAARRHVEIGGELRHFAHQRQQPIGGRQARASR